MQTCPHCNTEIRIRELPHPGLLKTFRNCPECGGRFTVDVDTRRRQAGFLIVALISLALTILLHFQGPQWLAPALVSYVVLAVLLYWGNQQVIFVPYENGRGGIDDT